MRARALIDGAQMDAYSHDVVMARFDLEGISRRLLRAPQPIETPSDDARAAVAIVLREPVPGDEVDILFIRRAERPHDPWSGHIAFPGGRSDVADETLLTTALRETYEEVGLRLDEAGTLLARLPDVPARVRGNRVGLTISPFVFALASRTVPLVIDEREVAEAIWMPIAPLARGEGKGIYAFEMSGDRCELPSLAVGAYTLWGLTYGMFQSFLSAVQGAD